MACNKDYITARMNRRVTLQRVSQTSDGQGGFTDVWVDVAGLWAAIEPLSGFEKLQAMQMQTPMTHKVTMRYRADVSTKDRLAYGSRLFHIKEALNLEENGYFLRLKCVEIA